MLTSWTVCRGTRKMGKGGQDKKEWGRAGWLSPTPKGLQAVKGGERSEVPWWTAGE